jgi:hypothetical protein
MRYARKAQRMGGGGRDINDPTPHERAAIIDADYNGPTGLPVGDANHGAEWQDAMLFL